MTTTLRGADAELADVIDATTLPAGSASTILRLERHGPATAAELGKALGRSPQRVAAVLRALRDEDLLEVTGHRREGRGRPARVHSLAAPLPELVATLRDLAHQRLQQRLRAVDALQALREQLAGTT